MHADQVTEPLAQHGEGPCWWEGWGGLKYVDLVAGDVLSLHDDGEVSRVHVGSVAAALRPRADGGAVIALERGFGLCRRADLSDVCPLGEVWSDPSIRFNDGGCDPEGRFYAGTMGYDERPGAGRMYRLSADGTGGFDTETMWTEVTISNGFAFSPDGSLAYYDDTPTGRTDVFDRTPDGSLVNRRPFMEHETGLPDGLCVDAEGYVWVALWGASAVHRISPDGKLDGIVHVPCTHVSACTFGGPALDTLYITTSKNGIPPGAEPEAGALFAVRPGVTGQPALPFRG
jgi:sugar lactone lactonase YvrE